MLIKSGARQDKCIDHSKMSDVLDRLREEYEKKHTDDPIVRLKQAQKVIDELQKELELTKKARYEEGFSKGKAVGFQEGLAYVQPHIQNLSGVLKDMEQRRQEIVEGAKQFVTDFSLKVVQKITSIDAFQGLKLDRTKLEELLALAVTQFGESTKYIVRVHKEVVESMTTYKEDLLCNLPNSISVTIVDDPSLKRSDCLVETDYGVLDARIESQLAEINHLFKNSESKINHAT